MVKPTTLMFCYHFYFLSHEKWSSEQKNFHNVWRVGSAEKKYEYLAVNCQWKINGKYLIHIHRRDRNSHTKSVTLPTFDMFFDLNVPIPSSSQPLGQSISKKGKGKQPITASPVTFNVAQINALEARIDLLVRCEFYLFCTISFLMALK